ncbi:asparagine synthase-related protein [Cupriavidus sp. PET2-C1]
MIIVTTKSHGEIEGRLRERDFWLSSDIQLHERGNFTCFVGGHFKFQTIGDATLVHTGRAVFRGKEVRPGEYREPADLAEDLRVAIGYFTFLLVESTRVTIISSLYRHIDIFYMAKGAEIVVSSDLSALLAIIGTRPINASFVSEFVNEDCFFRGDTLFEGVDHVPLGEALVLQRHVAPRREAWNVPKPRCVDFIEELHYNIRQFVADEERVFVQFSGGLDSSLILHIAKGIFPNCVALHLLSLDDAASEIDIARQVAGEFGVDLRIHESPVRFAAARSSFVMAGRINSPFDVYPLSPNPADRNFAYDEQIRAVGIDGGCFLTGQGGDYVFLQNPPPHVGLDGYRDGGLRGFIEAVKAYSQLKKVPFFRLLRLNIEAAFLGVRPGSSLTAARIGHCRAASPSRPHALLSKLPVQSPKFAHLQSVLMGLYQLRPNDGKQFRVIHPLFMQNILAGVLGEPVHRTFTADYDRIQIRRAFAQSSASWVAWRRTKRPSSGLVFSFFRNNEELVKCYLRRGIVASTIGIEDKWIDDTVTENANVVTTGEAGIVLNMLRLEMFAQSYARYIA